MQKSFPPDRLLFLVPFGFNQFKNQMGAMFANVLLPLPLPGYFTYRVPESMRDSMATGKRVVVPFGKRKVYTALVHDIHANAPEKVEAKDIISVLDPFPVVNDIQFSFWEWIAKYYMCTPGEVMNAALPSGLKLASESMICLNPEADLETADINEKEILVVEALLHRKKLSVNEVSDIAGQKKIIPMINNLIEKRLIFTEENLVDKYKPLTETLVRLSEDYEKDEERLKSLFDELDKRAFRQLQVLMAYLALARKPGETASAEVKKSELLQNKDVTIQAIQSLVKKGVLEFHEVEVSRLGLSRQISDPDSILFSAHQLKAFQSIQALFAEKEVVLLHGVTSSGKTEIYIKLISQVIREGRQVLYLLPEIALTSQIINRLRRYFGDKVGVYHSRYNDQERVEIWNHCLDMANGLNSGRFQVILGARSALFLPFSNLGLVIVDEEHDTSFKQHDPAPRYHARDAAIILAGMHNAMTILGTATPSVETYFNAVSGKFGLVELTERYGGISMPGIMLANIREELIKRTMQSHFTSHLMRNIREALENGEQVILFQNRRGFSPHLACDACDWIPMCRHCDISLTYHKRENKIQCHYCGYSEPLPNKCPQCGSTRILMKGFGTEKVEEELQTLFPDAVIRRMDLDSTRTKFGHHRIISEFEERRIQILVGTQMVTKGLDFDNVSVVGILNADSLLNYPDFRSHERSFQLMEQVSGRAGRKSKQGKVIIQSYNPSHRVIQFVVRHDYKGFFESQLEDRSKFHYPPFYRLIVLSLKHRDYKILNKAAGELASELRKTMGKRVLGPEYPLVSRIRNLYIKQVMIKIERGPNVIPFKDQIGKHIEEFQKIQVYRQVRVVVDVDPQ